MPGAKLDLPIDPPDDRGIRSPRHLAGLASQRPQALYPFMAAPLRPGETLSGVSVVGESNIASICNLVNYPLSWAEMGLWVVPVASLGQQFVDLIVNSGEDVVQQGMANLNPGTGVEASGAGEVANQGHQRTGTQHIPRLWAGEVGGIAGSLGIAQSNYMPYVSAATYKVAREWYDTQFGTVGFGDDDLYDNPPPIEFFNQGALRQNFNQGTAGLDDDLSSLSLSELVERMFLFSSSEYSYAEYLAAHGVNPRRAASIARPVMLRQAMLQNRGDGHPIFGTIPSDAAVIANGQSDTIQVKDLTTSNASLVHDRAPYGLVGHQWNASNNGDMFIEEPSILLGTMCWWSESLVASGYAHHLDMTRMTHPGHWGNRIGGGIDEEDFIAVQQLYNAAGDDLQAGSGSHGQTGSAIFNMLNLFINGDTYASADGAGTSEFFFRQPGGGVLNGVQGELTSKLSIQLRVMSDLVAS